MQTEKEIILSGLQMAKSLGITEMPKIADLLLHTINMAMASSGGNATVASQSSTSALIYGGTVAVGAGASGLPPSPQIVMPTEQDIIDAQRQRIDLAQDAVGSSEPESFGDVVIGKSASAEGLTGVLPWALEELRQHVLANSPATLPIVPRGSVRELQLARIVKSWVPAGALDTGFVSLTYSAGSDEANHCPKEVFNITQPKNQVNVADSVHQIKLASVVFYGEKTITKVSVAASAPGDKMEYDGPPMRGDRPGES